MKSKREVARHAAETHRATKGKKETHLLYHSCYAVSNPHSQLTISCGE